MRHEVKLKRESKRHKDAAMNAHKRKMRGKRPIMGLAPENPGISDNPADWYRRLCEAGNRYRDLMIHHGEPVEIAEKIARDCRMDAWRGNWYYGSQKIAAMACYPEQW